MIYLELFVGFLKVGCFSFGGAYAAIPIIRDVVLSYGWITDEMLSYMIAVSESTPGPIMVNLATYIGSAQGGVWGAVIATLTVVLPAFLIVVFITAFLFSKWNHPFWQAALKGLKPCMIGIILYTAAEMIFKNIASQGFDWLSLAFTAALALLFFGLPKISRFKISPILLIVISAAMGMVVFA